jgi:hypothetical protein
MTPYSVVLKEDVAVDPRTYGALLAPVLGLTLVDARMAVRRGSGLVAENLPEEDARRIAAAFEADGLACWCVPSASLPPARAPRRVTAIEALPEGLCCSLQDQPAPQTVPWDRIAAVSIGLVLVPELQEEIAGIRKKDVAVVWRREQEQRDLVRDRLLAALGRVDLAHEENAPAAGAHHYFFDQLRRRESKQMKVFADLAIGNGSELWRISLEDSSFVDRTEDPSDPGPEAANYLAVPVVYARRGEAHTERSRKLFQGGNIERLAFHTMEEFNRYTRWWACRELLESDPALAIPPAAAAEPSGNGRAPHRLETRADRPLEPDAPPPAKWRTAAVVALLSLLLAIGAGVRFEQRGADCLVCKGHRQDEVFRIWGAALREKPGEWRKKFPPSLYDQVVGREHAHLFDGFGYMRRNLLGTTPEFGRTPGGNVTPEERDACACAEALLLWVDRGEASHEDVAEVYGRLYEKVKSIRDEAGRRRWLELARRAPDKSAPESLMTEIRK